MMNYLMIYFLNKFDGQKSFYSVNIKENTFNDMLQFTAKIKKLTTKMDEVNITPRP